MLYMELLIIVIVWMEIWRVLVTIIALGSCTPKPGTSHNGGWGVAQNHSHHQLQWKSLYDRKERSEDGPTHRGKKGRGIMPWC